MNTLHQENSVTGEQASALPCDLCGGIHLSSTTTPGGRSGRVCAECGLVEVEGTENRPLPLPERLLGHLGRPMFREPGRRLLLIGDNAESAAGAARRAGLRLTLLPIASLVNPLAPEHVEMFDHALVVTDLHTLPSPAEAFETARRALRPGGELAVATIAADSLLARIRPSVWERRWIADAHAWLLTGDHLRRYAHRHALAVRSIRSHGGPLAPLGIGPYVTATFTHVHATVRVRGDLRRAEREPAVGLAPALRTTVERERV